MNDEVKLTLAATYIFSGEETSGYEASIKVNSYTVWSGTPLHKNHFEALWAAEEKLVAVLKQLFNKES